MYTTTTNDDSLKNGLTVSGGLHLALFLFLYFGLPHLIPPLPAHHDPVPFEIVTIADITNTRVTPDQQPDKPAPPPTPAKAAPTPPAPQEKPTPAAPAPPTQPQAEALKPKIIEKPKPVEKPAPQQDMLASVLKDVAKMKPTPPPAPTQEKADAKATPAPATSSRHLNMAETMTIQDALRRKMEQIWNPPIGARDAQNLVVEIIINVNPDHTIGIVDIVDKARYNTDSFFRAASDAAVRAAHDPRFKLDDIPLPADTYDDWKHLDLVFNPKDMI